LKAGGCNKSISGTTFAQVQEHFMGTGFHNFIHLLFIGIIALFPVVNPIGSAFIVSPYLSPLSRDEKRTAVKKISLYAFCICTVSLFAGHWILELFGLSIPVIQLAGGIMICKMGWGFLSDDKKSDEPDSGRAKEGATSGYAHLQDKLFYPITFPLTTGAGTISVLFTLSAHSAGPKMSDYLLGTGAILSAIVVMCVLVYIFYLSTKTISNFLGSKGEAIINRLIAFLVFCVGLQIAVTGIKAIVNA
jgi:multiple antibiotic resistance protein